MAVSVTSYRLGLRLSREKFISNDPDYNMMILIYEINY